MAAEKKINILFVMPQMGMGGSERLVHTLAKRLDRKRFEPHVAWFKGGDAIKEFKDLKVPLFNIGKAEGFDFKAIRRLSGVIRDNRIDVVNAQHFMPAVYSFYGCRVARKRALVYTLHSEWELDLIPFKWTGIGRFIFRDTHFISVTDGASEAVIKKFRLRPGNVSTISNGVDLKVFCPGDKKKKAMRLAGVNGARYTVGMVANFKKVKNHLFLLKAFRDLLSEMPGGKLILPGQGFKGDDDNTEEEIRRFIKDEGLEKDVLLPGYMEDVSGVLGMLDVFCLTSRKEGLPISLIEAMASGLPVIGTDVEGVQKVISNGENGFLVKEGDITGMKDALLRVLRDEKLRKDLGARSRELAGTKYSIENCVARYQDLYISLSR